ncbi:hypothetical protein EJ03DRAFT_192017 [Teratosphaeria nubilosa]|uniref:Uncharacterized protein n=1 Tax=Teratosphaeria nubilosa TaxID=161662 RepID=A0A6G1KZC3_9PEZI|nr:hypothetical protein EJ03DRAFT_192017 [Teratosphaeria nubilosa]
MRMDHFINTFAWEVTHSSRTWYERGDLTTLEPDKIIQMLQYRPVTNVKRYDHYLQHLLLTAADKQRPCDERTEAPDFIKRLERLISELEHSQMALIWPCTCGLLQYARCSALAVQELSATYRIA